MGNIGPNWKKSSRSSSNGNCVEARECGQQVQMRDSKDAAGPVLGFSQAAWQAFIDRTKSGDFS